MAIPKIMFRMAGGPLEVELKFGYAQTGTYTLLVWESGSNDIVMQEKGNNDNPEDDRFPLPLPTSKNDGRVVDCVATVVAPNPGPGEQYSVDVIVYQGGNEIGRVTDSGALTDTSLTRELMAKLVGQ